MQKNNVKKINITWNSDDIRCKHYEMQGAEHWLFDNMEDCLTEVKQKGLRVLTDDECSDILQALEKNYDCEFGITWNHVQSEIKNYLLNEEK